MEVSPGMTATPKQPEPDRIASDTAQRLIGAATAEFCEHGFAGTDTNRIARRAGFAPQTFYRWFKDKTEIFLAVYRDWEEMEHRTIAGLIEKKAPVSQMVDAIVEHHRAFRIFRRSLRQLSLEDDAVRAARAQSRLRQLGRISGGKKPKSRLAALAVALFEVERLCDAVAEGEFADLGLDEKAARAVIGERLTSLRR
ncbi:MAG: TetR/AcrR family transcriptional regulator [Parvibaculum sp.]|uniref:TetR/AcrR family transcriptional regulator n=1 Tax=Parvibaculum sp. TaxID=2024848 RepID=UPI00349FE8BA